MSQGKPISLHAEARHFDEGPRFQGVQEVGSEGRPGSLRALAGRPRAAALDPGIAQPLRRHAGTPRCGAGAGRSASKPTSASARSARGKYGDEPFERILLNGKPIYLRTALDQSFNPKGLYTAPDDEFLRRDMEITKSMGLNGLRIHIKPDEPRRLYWADRAGVLILEDMPNTWQQNPRARSAWEKTMREAMARDLQSPGDHRLGRLQRDLGPGQARRLQEGQGHPAMGRRDGPGHPRRSTRRGSSRTTRRATTTTSPTPTSIAGISTSTTTPRPASTSRTSWIGPRRAARFNYCPGLRQSALPLINSEYGSVSAGGGDRDISWGLRDLTTQLRRHRKIQGFVYTELTDIEWEHNGLVNYDRTPKLFGYDTWLPDMRPNELLGADFVGYDSPPAIVGKPGETVTVPIFVSHFSERSVPAQAEVVGQRLRRAGRHPRRGGTEERPDHLAALRRQRARADPRQRSPADPSSARSS